MQLPTVPASARRKPSPISPSPQDPGPRIFLHPKKFSSSPGRTPPPRGDRPPKLHLYTKSPSKNNTSLRFCRKFPAPKTNHANDFLLCENILFWRNLRFSYGELLRLSYAKLLFPLGHIAIPVRPSDSPEHPHSPEEGCDFASETAIWSPA